MKKLMYGAALVVAALAFTNNAASAASLCVPGPNADGLAVTDVKLEGVSATNCYGVVSGNNSNQNMNTLAGGALLFGGTNWGAEIKDDSPGAPGSGTGSFYGVNWTLTSSAGTVGTWGLSFVDKTPSVLNFTADLLVIVKASDRYAAYYFNDFLFDSTSNSGVWDINFVNNGGQTPGLSHLAVYFRDGKDVPDCVPGSAGCPNPRDVPEPATLALFGVGLLGAGVVRRRK